MRSGSSVHQYVYFALPFAIQMMLHQLSVLFHLIFFNLHKGFQYFFNIEFPRNYTWKMLAFFE